MNIVEALRISDVIRRKGKSSHIGSHGTGWVHVDILLTGIMSSLYDYPVGNLKLTKDDLLADDWEARETS